jgi:hypothetical protein
MHEWRTCAMLHRCIAHCCTPEVTYIKMLSDLISEQRGLLQELSALQSELNILERRSAEDMELLWGRHRLHAFVRDGLAALEDTLMQLEQMNAQYQMQPMQHATQTVTGAVRELANGNEYSDYMQTIQNIQHYEALYLKLEQLIQVLLELMQELESNVQEKVKETRQFMPEHEDHLKSLTHEVLDQFAQQTLHRFVEKENYANIAREKQTEYESMIAKTAVNQSKISQFTDLKIKMDAFQDVIHDLINECGVFSPESDSADHNAQVLDDARECFEEIQRNVVRIKNLQQHSFGMIEKNEMLVNNLFERVQSSFDISKCQKEDAASRSSYLIEKIDQMYIKEDYTRKDTVDAPNCSKVDFHFPTEKEMNNTSLISKRKEKLFSHVDIDHSQIHSYIMKLVNISKITEDEDLKSMKYEVSRATDMLNQVGLELKKNRETIAEISSWGRLNDNSSVKI